MLWLLLMVVVITVVIFEIVFYFSTAADNELIWAVERLTCTGEIRIANRRSENLLLWINVFMTFLFLFRQMPKQAKIVDFCNLAVSNFNTVIIRVSVNTVVENMLLTAKRKTGRRCGAPRRTAQYTVNRVISLLLSYAWHGFFLNASGKAGFTFLWNAAYVLAHELNARLLFVSRIQVGEGLAEHMPFASP